MRTSKTPSHLAVCLLCVLMTLTVSLSDAVSPTASAAFEDALNKLVSWKVMRGDASGDLREKDPITRGEFIAMINRAYGYTETGPVPFTDIDPHHWCYDDIAIAYRSGYFNGKDETTAAADETITREQGLVLLARNLRLQPGGGSSIAFSDSDQFSGFSRPYVQEAVEKQLVAGYPDGTFRPQNLITRGETAQMISNAVGTLVQDSGEQSLGDVFGNLTINTSNTTLKNTTIAGNLYISGGLDLGSVTLENVKVLGQIVVAGGGESEGGDNSVILRNTEAPVLLVDNLKGQYLSLGVEGDTLIDTANIRSDTYVQDRTGAGFGLLNINLNSTETNRNYSLSGNLETVVNKAPNSKLTIGQGTVESLTIDELAAGSSLIIAQNATVKTLNLDTGTPVTGSGDVEQLNVNTAGSTVSMLPDQISIRPGIDANIWGQSMDSKTAQESSAAPRLLAGYPKATDIAPTNLKALFSGNKAGTVYWAVSAVTDGSVDEADLIKPPSYGSKAIRSGNIALSAADTPVTAAVSGLSRGGSYYLAAVLVDNRDNHSPVKVISFSTPDDSVPAFANGYPAMSKITGDSAQVAVMSTKTCKLYYAVFPKNSTAPTGEDLKAAAVSGNLGYGTKDLTRNVPDYITVNNKPLTEMETYDLYLWLTDADGAKSSAVRKLTFTTKDITPPIFLTKMEIQQKQVSSVTTVSSVNENATIYWVVTRANDSYPKIHPTDTEFQNVKYEGIDEPFTDADKTLYDKFLQTSYSKFQIANGMNGIRAGSVNAQANTDVRTVLSGLQPEIEYKVYYLAKDAAGNYSDVHVLDEIYTLDSTAPTVRQEFTDFSEENASNPYANTDVRIIFSEYVQKYGTARNLLQLYNAYTTAAANSDEKANALQTFAKTLSETIELYNVTRTNEPQPVEVRSDGEHEGANDIEWIIDYRKATVEVDNDKQMIVTFKTDADLSKSALNLSSGATYFFRIRDIADQAGNIMAVTDLPRFTTLSAQVAIDPLDITGTYLVPDASGKYTIVASSSTKDTDKEVDMAFTLTPMSTSKADPDVAWDMLLWANVSCEYQLYYREVKKADAKNGMGGDWKLLKPDDKGDDFDAGVAMREPTFIGTSRNLNFKDYNAFPKIRDGEEDCLDEETVYQYIVHFTSLNSVEEMSSATSQAEGRDTWSQSVDFRVNVLSGSTMALRDLATDVTEARFNNALTTTTTLKVNNIGIPETFTMRAPFTDKSAPRFDSDRPQFEVADTSVTMDLLLNRPGTVYYVVAPVGRVPAQSMETSLYWESSPKKYDSFNFVHNNTELNGNGFYRVPVSGFSADNVGTALLKGGTDETPTYTPYLPFYLSKPAYLDIVNPRYNNPLIKTGVAELGAGSMQIPVGDLEPNTQYYVYFVIKGTGQVYSTPQLYRFETTEVQRPVLTLVRADNPVVTIKSNQSANVDYILIHHNSANNVPELNQTVPAGEEDGKKLIFNTRGERVTVGANGEPTDGSTAMTVLQAMIEPHYDANGDRDGSYFDFCSDTNLKNQVANYIRGSVPNTGGLTSGITLVSSTSVNLSTNVDCSRYMTEANQYYFLAVGKSDRGSGDAFAAIWPVMLGNSQKIMVSSISTNFDIAYANDDPTTDTKGIGVSGLISVSFNGYLNNLQSSTSPNNSPKLTPFDQGPLTSTGKPGDQTYYSVGMLQEPGSKLHILYGEDLKKLNPNIVDPDDRPTDSMILRFGDKEDGGTPLGPGNYTITLHPFADKGFDGYFANSNSIANSSDLVISLRVTYDIVRYDVDNDGKRVPIYGWNAVASVSRGWDATGQ